MAAKYPNILRPYWRYEYSKFSPPGVYRADPFVGLKTADAKKRMIIKKGKWACIILNKFPYAPGHLLVVPYRKVGPIEELTAAERVEIFELIVEGKLLLEKVLKCHAANIGVNQGEGDVSGGSVPSHIHFHIVPRWRGDNSYLPVISGTRLMIRSMESVFCALVQELKGMEAKTPKPTRIKAAKRVKKAVKKSAKK